MRRAALPLVPRLEPTAGSRSDGVMELARPPVRDGVERDDMAEPRPSAAVWAATVFACDWICCITRVTPRTLRATAEVGRTPRACVQHRGMRESLFETRRR